MYKKAYILVFDKNDIDTEQLRNIIISYNNSGIIYNWWNYIKCAYIIISNKSADELAKGIGNNLTSDKKFLLIEVNMKNRQGWLTKEAWNWINNNTDNLYSLF